MHNLPISLDYSEGVDRKVLKALTQRFCGINRQRLARARSALTRRQQTVLDVLPLAFHLNHPALPGYFGDCPAGLSCYEPGADTVSAAQGLARSFRLPRNAPRKRDLTGIFLMGSPGSLGHSVASDLDVWLCHQSGLGGQEVAALTEKAARLSRWAAEFGIELNIFVFCASDYRDRLKQTGVSGESSGSAQHFLLLDEFYRTAIHLGGQYPLWWLIAPDDEARYTELADFLLTRRFVREEEYLDFGPLVSIPEEEYLGAGIWQLYKGIDSPWKSLLKLLLIECYARNRRAGPLSADYKRAVFAGETCLDALDPYVMLYRRLERWLLASSAPSRLDLVRRALYLKAGLPLTRADEAAGRWQGRLLRHLVTEWEWDDGILAELDGRNQWRPEKVIQLRKRIVAELTHSYRLLSKLARNRELQASIRPEDLNLLGRKLYAAFQRKAGKVEYINPGIVPSLSEENLAFCQAAGDSASGDAWLLFRNLDNFSDIPWANPIRRAGSLVELVLWCHCNGLLSPVTRLNLRSSGIAMTVDGLKSMVAFLRAALPVRGEVGREALSAARRPLRHLLLVNVGVDPLSRLTEKGLHMLSGRHDSLGFSGGRDNLVASIDQITENSWHEVSLQRYVTGDALVQCLKNVLATMARFPAEAPEILVQGGGAGHSRPIARRVTELFADVRSQFFAGGTGPHSMRYVLEMDSRYFILRFDGEEPGFTGLASKPALMDFLARPQSGYCPVVFDRHALVSDPALRAVCQASQPDLVQVFFQVADTMVRFWVVDELGSVYGWLQPFAGSRRQVLTPLFRFLESLMERRQLRQLSGSPDSAARIHCAEVRVSGGRALLERVPAPPTEEVSDPLLEVQAVGVQEGDGTLGFDLFCGDREFRREAWGDAQMAEAARYIRSMRKDGAVYPVYLTDLYLPHDLEPGLWQQDLQTCQYIWYRQQLQASLNQAVSESQVRE